MGLGLATVMVGLLIYVIVGNVISGNSKWLIEQLADKWPHAIFVVVFLIAMLVSCVRQIHRGRRLLQMLRLREQDRGAYEK